MGRVEISLVTTLDLVAEAPGGPDEGSDFAFGGWQAPLMDPVVGERIGAAIAGIDALLLGRKTYDANAGIWPTMPDDFAGGMAGVLNRVPKYVASRGSVDLTWANSTQLGPDIAAAVNDVRSRHEHIYVIGSLDFVQTLLAERLFDRLSLYLYPIVLGSGRTVFGSGAIPANLTLAEPAISTPDGTLILRYDLAEGIPATGSMDEVVSE